jgi:hypothetical protein
MPQVGDRSLPVSPQIVHHLDSAELELKYDRGTGTSRIVPSSTECLSSLAANWVIFSHQAGLDGTAKDLLTRPSRRYLRHGLGPE